MDNVEKTALLVNRLTVNGWQVKRFHNSYLDGIYIEINFRNRDGQKCTFYRDGRYRGILNDTGDALFSLFNINGEGLPRDIAELLFPDDKPVTGLPLADDFVSRNTAKADYESYIEHDGGIEEHYIARMAYRA